MSTNYKIYDPKGIYFITSAIIEHVPIFLNESLFNIILDSFKFCRKEKGLMIYAYVIMDNHFHAVISGEDITGNIRSIKSYTAKRIIEELKKMKSNWLFEIFSNYKKEYKKNSNFQIWQDGYHPQQIISDEMFLQKIEYIHNNPVKRGFVEKGEDWKYSSARNFIGDNSIFEIDYLV